MAKRKSSSSHPQSKRKSKPKSSKQETKSSLSTITTATVSFFGTALFTVSLLFLSKKTITFTSASKKSLIANDQVCNSSDTSASAPSYDGPLRPIDLPQPTVFSSFTTNSTLILPNGITQPISSGTVKQINNYDNNNNIMVDFALLPSAVPRSKISAIRSLLSEYNDWDDDPDSVDGMTSHEMFVDSPDLIKSGEIKFRDVDPEYAPARRVLRQKLKDIMQPYIDNVITPAVHARYKEACTKSKERECTPCYGLIRKYQHGQRQSHAAHHDGHALVTVVISLSDYNSEYRGGLYVSSGFAQREFLGLNRGDAVMHQSSLLHGVQVYPLIKEPEKTQRWSWILWYKDSSSCKEDYSYEWFKSCSDAGNTLCQQLHASKIEFIPNISPEESSRQILELNLSAANGGSGYSAVKIARAYLGQLQGSSLEVDYTKAKKYFTIAITSSNSPDGHYGMAQMLLMEVMAEYSHSNHQELAWKDDRVSQAVKHLETAAMAGHAYSKFNLGMVHTFGYLHGVIDVDLAGAWFEASGMPEGYMLASQQAGVKGDTVREKEMAKLAEEMGINKPWRLASRMHSGSGGSGGVDINLPWPPSFDGRLPPQF